MHSIRLTVLGQGWGPRACTAEVTAVETRDLIGFNHDVVNQALTQSVQHGRRLSSALTAGRAAPEASGAGSRWEDLVVGTCISWRVNNVDSIHIRQNLLTLLTLHAQCL